MDSTFLSRLSEIKPYSPHLDQYVGVPILSDEVQVARYRAFISLGREYNTKTYARFLKNGLNAVPKLPEQVQKRIHKIAKSYRTGCDHEDDAPISLQIFNSIDTKFSIDYPSQDFPDYDLVCSLAKSGKSPLMHLKKVEDCIFREEIMKYMTDVYDSTILFGLKGVFCFVINYDMGKAYIQFTPSKILTVVYGTDFADNINDSSCWVFITLVKNNDMCYQPVSFPHTPCKID